MKSNLPFIHLKPDVIYIQPIEINPIEGYKTPINKDNQRPLPHCCSIHSKMYDGLKKWYKKFPNCCEFHKDLSKRKLFKSEWYKNLPYKIIQNLSYTEYFIRQKINSPNWYKEITDYIEYNIDSFGQPAIGSSHYLYQLKWTIENNINAIPPIYTSKKSKLLRFVNELSSSPKKNKKNTDLNLLHSIFLKWLKALPDLSYFIAVKEKFKKTIPINLLFKDPCQNPYTGMVKFKPRTPKELVKELHKVTNTALSVFDNKSLIAKGIISDKEQHQIDLEFEHHRLTQAKLVGDYNGDEKKYIKTIKKWLANEKTFFKSVSPQFSKIQKQLKSAPKVKVKEPPKLENNNQSFEKLFRYGANNKVINFLKKKQLIEIETDGRYCWIDDDENVFIAFFWSLYNFEQENNSPILKTPLPSISKYQKTVFNAFQIKNWSVDKFQKHTRHNYKTQAEIKSFIEVLQPIFG